MKGRDFKGDLVADLLQMLNDIDEEVRDWRGVAEHNAANGVKATCAIREAHVVRGVVVKALQDLGHTVEAGSTPD